MVAETTSQHRPTIRKRKTEAFQAYKFSNTAMYVRDWLTRVQERAPDAYITYEPGMFVSYNGQEARGKHVLWVKQADIALLEGGPKPKQITMPQSPPYEPEMPILDKFLSAIEDTPATKPQLRSKSSTPPWMNMLREGFTDGNGHRYDPSDFVAPPLEPELPDLEDVREGAAHMLREMQPDIEEMRVSRKISVLPWCNTPDPEPEEPEYFRTKYAGILRCNSRKNRNVGYRAKLTRGGITRSKFFSDSKHGGRLSALAASLDWRRTQEKLMTATARSARRSRQGDGPKVVTVDVIKEVEVIREVHVVQVQLVPIQRKRGNGTRHEILHAPCVTDVALHVARDLGFIEQTTNGEHISSFELWADCGLMLHVKIEEYRVYLERYCQMLLDQGRPAAMLRRGSVQVIGDA